MDCLIRLPTNWANSSNTLLRPDWHHHITWAWFSSRLPAYHDLEFQFSYAHSRRRGGLPHSPPNWMTNLLTRLLVNGKADWPLNEVSRNRLDGWADACMLAWCRRPLHRVDWQPSIKLAKTVLAFYFRTSPRRSDDRNAQINSQLADLSTNLLRYCFQAPFVGRSTC